MDQLMSGRIPAELKLPTTVMVSGLRGEPRETIVDQLQEILRVANLRLDYCQSTGQPWLDVETTTIQIAPASEVVRSQETALLMPLVRMARVVALKVVLIDVPSDPEDPAGMLGGLARPLLSMIDDQMGSFVLRAVTPEQMRELTARQTRYGS